MCAAGSLLIGDPTDRQIAKRRELTLAGDRRARYVRLGSKDFYGASAQLAELAMQSPVLAAVEFVRCPSHAGTVSHYD